MGRGASQRVSARRALAALLPRATERGLRGEAEKPQRGLAPLPGDGVRRQRRRQSQDGEDQSPVKLQEKHGSRGGRGHAESHGLGLRRGQETPGEGGQQERGGGEAQAEQRGRARLFPQFPLDDRVHARAPEPPAY